MHEHSLILTLTTALSAALVLGYITHRLSLSPLVGYLLAGIAIGPRTPGFVANRELANQMAEIGVILLMFGVGLHFHLKDLVKVRRVAVPGAIGQSFVATVLGCLLGVGLGWGWPAGLVFGLAISVASTVVLLRVLADNNDLHTPAGHMAVGWLLVEDLLTVLVLVLLPVIFQGRGDGAALPEGQAWRIVAITLLWAVVKVTLFLAFVFYVAGRVVPWFFERVARTRSRELFTLSVLVLALGLAVGATRLFGVSPELGAFLAGMVVGQSEFSSRAASDAIPMRDAFAVLFFVSVGMLFDPVYALESPLLVGATLAIVLLGKPLAALAIVLALRYPLHVALSIAVALAQVGEFSFILGTLGLQIGILSETANNAIIAAALVSISINPLIYPLVGILEKRIKKSPRLSAWFIKPMTIHPPQEERGDALRESRAVVVGYGPVGRTLVRMLIENDIEPTVIELNLDTVHRLRYDGVRAVYGDSTHRQTLEEAGIKGAIAFVLTSAGMRGSDEAIRLARDINPSIRVFARAAYLKEIPALRRAGADVVFSAEGEVALTMTEFLLRQLGASEEQIDHQRQKTRDELFGTPLTMELLLPLPGPKLEIEPATKVEAHAADGPGDSPPAEVADKQL
jgi:CPA2 family monovalent cation:H+ antiporter-2